MGYVKGIVYLVLWYSSILGGYAGLFCPILPLIFVSNRLYRTAADYLFTFWQMYPTALLEILCNCKINVTGDEIKANETSLLVMNHRTRTDWTFVWPAVYYATTGPGRWKHPTKFVLKDEIRHIPGIGWVMQLACFLYIRRNWQQDKAKLTRMIDYFSDWKYKFSLLIFPEGTDFTPKTKHNSDLYAEKQSLVKYDYVLHPRTTGFAYLSKRLLEKGALDAVYDVTIIYCDNIPQNEKHLLKGNFPHEVKIHFNRHPACTLPTNENDLRIFLEKRWQEKERNIREFYTSRHFLHGKPITRCNKRDLYAALLFWTVLPPVVLYVMLTVQIFRNIVLGHTVLLVALGVFTDGFQSFEISLYNAKRIIGRQIGYL